ncbi:MAG TPA: GFA family protein [Kofleriaceae bacterium]
MRTYQGSCHCGAVAYEVDMESVNGAMACNCSMCRRAGTLFTFVPDAAFRLTRGDDAIGDYQFNKHAIHHLFCKTCGIKSFARGKKPDGSAMVAINVRCLDGIDPDKLEIKHFDGASH